jgi:hypothetical protein
VFGFGVNEIDAGVVGCYVNVTVGVGGESAGERREVRESDGERGFEGLNKVFKGIRRCRK